MSVINELQVAIMPTTDQKYARGPGSFSYVVTRGDNNKEHRASLTFLSAGIRIQVHSAKPYSDVCNEIEALEGRTDEGVMEHIKASYTSSLPKNAIEYMDALRMLYRAYYLLYRLTDGTVAGMTSWLLTNLISEKVGTAIKFGYVFDGTEDQDALKRLFVDGFLGHFTLTFGVSGSKSTSSFFFLPIGQQRIAKYHAVIEQVKSLSLSNKTMATEILGPTFIDELTLRKYIGSAQKLMPSRTTKQMR